MPFQALAMAALAAVLMIAGAALLWRLRRPLSAQRVYAYRMVGIMALSAGIVLGFSAAAIWRWSIAP